MQSQVIICDQQTIYAMGCSLLIKDNPMLLGYHIIQGLKELDGFMNKDKSQQALPLILVADSALFDYGHSAEMAQIASLKKKIVAL